MTRARISSAQNQIHFFFFSWTVGQVGHGVFLSYVEWVGFFLPERDETCARSLPVPPRWLQRGVPGHPSTMNTAQRSQATSQIAGLPHLIHSSNYTISCHYSCYLDLSSWPRQGGLGLSDCPGSRGGRKERSCSIQGFCTWGCKMELFGSGRRGNCSGSSLSPASDGRWFYKSASSLCAAVWGVVFLIFFSSLHMAWSLPKLVLQSKEVRSDDDG